MSTTEELDISTTETDGTTVMTVRGEIDVNTCGQLQEALSAAGGTQLELDLTDVGFIDSSGLRSVIAGQRLISEAGGSLRIVALSPPARRLLEITGLLELFQVQ